MDANKPSLRARLRRRVPVILTMLCGTALTVALFLNARQLEQRRVQLEFEQSASAINTALQRRIAANIEVLQSISSLYAASKEVDADEFDEFAAPSLRVYPGIQWLAWAPRVPADRVAEHMAEAATLKTRPGYAIRGLDGAPLRPPTSLPAAAGAADLFPVHFICPYDKYAPLAGIEMSADPACREAMTASIARNHAVATDPADRTGSGNGGATKLGPGHASGPWNAFAAEFDSLVFLPIYANKTHPADESARRQHLTGYAVAALRFADLMASAVRLVDAKGQEIRLYDHDANGKPRVLFRSVPDNVDERLLGREDLATKPWARSLTIGGRELTMKGLPTLERAAAERHLGPWAVLGGGLLCTALMGAYLRTASGKAATIERTVGQRTGELIKANADLEKQVAERREAEKALREAEAVYHSLVETLPQNIFRKDLQGRFTFGNRHFCQVLGTAPRDLIGKTDLDFFPAALANRYRDDDRNVIESGKTMDLVEEHVKPDGDKLYVQVMKTPVYGPGGSITGTQGIFWDVTDRKLAEQELEKKNTQLEEAARSERLAHQALQYAHDELKRAQTHLVQSEKLAGLGQMVAGVAHEINNPLAFVSNNVAVLQRDIKSVVELLNLYKEADPLLTEKLPDLIARLRDLEEQMDLAYTLSNLDELLVRSRDGLRRIQQIVKDLRNFARLDEADLTEVDINQGIESTVNIVLGHAKKKQVRIEKDLSQLPQVMCYPAKVNQVVMNLITNAIDASKENGRVLVKSYVEDGKIPGSAKPQAADGEVERVVKIEVSDEGTGIDPAIRQRIFDPFFTTKPVGHGTGLGLSISYGIIQDHGGTIAVDSTVGVGTRFTISLPVRHMNG